MVSRAVLACAAVLALVLGPLASQPGLADPPAARNYIVVWRDEVDADRETDAVERNEHVRVEFRYAHALKGFAASLNDAQLAALRRNPGVKFISDDREVQAVGTVPLVAGDSAPTGVRRIDAATTTTAQEASTVNVAVIDTGIQLSHPDLNAVAGRNCVRSNRSPNDDNGHGTHVSGTIGARNQGTGVVGVAPGTTLYAVKVLNSSGSGTWSQVICGIDWVTANAAALNIKVASMSLGGSGSNDNGCGNFNFDALHQAICRSANAGVTYVVAAGNSGANFAGAVPAAYPEVLTVTAMSDSDGVAGGTGGAPTCRFGETDDAYATFSNYAAAATEINHAVAGPGVCITSTWTGSGYNTISGTSMATPHVSGTVALCFGSGGSAGPCAGLAPAQVIQRIRSDAQAHATASNGFNGDPNHPIAGRFYGYLAWAGAYTGGSTPPPPPPSGLTITSVAASAITSTSATITWTTSQAASSQVSYKCCGAASYTDTAIADTSPGVTSHSVQLSGLSSDTVYTYHVTSTTTDGSATATSADQTFRTLNNNNFADAYTVSVGSSASGSNGGATLQSGEPRPCGLIGATLWYAFTPSTSGAVRASTDNAGTSFDTVLAVYSGTSLTSLTTLGCQDDVSYPANLRSTVTVNVTAGTTYYVQVGGYNGATGSFVLSLS